MRTELKKLNKLTKRKTNEKKNKRIRSKQNKNRRKKITDEGTQQIYFSLLNVDAMKSEPKFMV